MNTMIHIVPNEGVTFARGFQSGGLYCGIRKKKKDLAIIKSDAPAAVAAVFTQNKTIAAPVVVSKRALLESKRCSAIVVNSGNANACTGARGMKDAEQMVAATSAALSIPANEVIVASTGVIGQFLPIDLIEKGIAELAPQLNANSNADAAEAIMTTDTFAKSYAVSFEIAGTQVRIGGIAKGSGMIEPNMATMLAFITSDVHIDQSLLQRTFYKAVAQSFNRISVDGDTSTNDMAVMLANGESNTPKIELGTPEYDLFCKALVIVTTELAKMIARDGEGATKLIEIEVGGASSEDEALKVARSIANSNLVKTAIHGEDPNWGRIIAAIGYSGIDLDPEFIELSLNTHPVLRKQYQIVIDEPVVQKSLKEKDILLSIDLGRGTEAARFWTCDLTKDYISINASYRS
ncbi:MAG TPA: bifunctional glutamate N-acetyltransferase/amino-acid acetyltransferase ArgJ [Candidatus Kapabacteria bacterium]|nr:bifunctional glutamate N-acetyltransferase/amino-acid acetyltransferase ArgJ [Candidatus Kapabacteria bacterium]